MPVRIRTSPQVVYRDRLGRFASRGRRDTIRQPVAHPPGNLPTWVILDDGTRLRTTSKIGRLSIPLFEALEPLLARAGLTFPDRTQIHHVKYAYEQQGIPAAWLREPDGQRPESLEEEEAPAAVRPPVRVPRRRPVVERAPRVARPERRAAVPAPARRARRGGYRIVVVRRDRAGRFNSRGRTVQRLKIPIRKT